MKMKNIFIGVLAIMLGLFSCKQDDLIKEVEKKITAPALVNPTGTSQYVLITENDEGAFETFAWEKAYLGEGKTITYQVQMDLVGNDFADAVDLGDPTEHQYLATKSGEMNMVLRLLGVPNDEHTNLEVRVVASSGEMQEISNPVTIAVVRYQYEDEVIVWGLVGTAVNPDDTNEHMPLVYDAGSETWKATLLLNAGEFKFKDKSYRQTILGASSVDGELVENGDAIAVENAVYSIVLDVENLVYTIEKSSFPNNLYLVGRHNGWNNPGDGSGVLPSAHKNFFNGTYEVYQNFADDLSDFECKWILEIGSWAGDMGDDPANPGNIIDEGETNVNLMEAGFYWIKADLASMTWESKKTVWGIIGNATPGDWSAQTNFTNFDATTNTFTMEAALTQGELKFRGTDDWSVNYGGLGLSGEPLPGGANIVIEEAGTYDITLKLGHGGDYNYSIVKK